ncbi:MAG: hypothetical protein M0P34_14355, partial [Desulfocurvus sp.]|nr:hypothetical protein [Desulfocurvus sp.]
MQLTPRQHAVLTTIVDAYIDTARPVGSRAVSKASGLSLSPASMRNTMAELATAAPRKVAINVPLQELREDHVLDRGQANLAVAFDPEASCIMAAAASVMIVSSPCCPPR